jgi:hypothetical protein
MDSVNNINGIIQTQTTNYSNAHKITKSEWLDVDFCNCGKTVFKYQDTTNNVFVLKCKNTLKKEMEFIHIILSHLSQHFRC